MEDDDEMEEDSTSNVEMVLGQGTFIVGPGHVTVTEVRVVSNQKHMLCHSR